MRQTDAIPEATQTAKKQLAAGDISGAEQLLSQQRQITPQDRETHYYYCVCLRYLNRLPDAQGELETPPKPVSSICPGLSRNGLHPQGPERSAKGAVVISDRRDIERCAAWQLAGPD